MALFKLYYKFYQVNIPPGCDVALLRVSHIQNSVFNRPNSIFRDIRARGAENRCTIVYLFDTQIQQ